MPKDTKAYWAKAKEFKLKEQAGAYIASSDLIVKMSEKGQLVVPLSVRETAELYPGQSFEALPIEQGVLFRKIQPPDRSKEFLKLAKRAEAHVKKYGLTEKDVKEAIEWARKH